MKREVVERLLQILRLRNSHPPLTSWSDEDAAGLPALLFYEGAELWFYRRVQQLKLAIPDTLRAELRQAAQRISIINMRIDGQTVSVTSMMSDAGLDWCLLKGQARRAAAARYPFADARPVSDVDLLMPAGQAKQGWELLMQNGFRKYIDEPVDWSADHHLPTLIDEKNNVAVELHTTTTMTVSPDEAWRRATSGSDAVEWSGIDTRVPNATELVWQALAHGSGDGSDGFYLKTFLSIASVLATEPVIDWSIIERRLNSNEVLDNNTKGIVRHESVRRFLDVAADLAGTTIPASLQPKRRANLVSLLMWRGDMLASSRGRATRERFLEESARVETLLPLTPIVRNVGAWPAIRRRSSSIVARAAYLAWRARA